MLPRANAKPSVIATRVRVCVCVCVSACVRTSVAKTKGLELIENSVSSANAPRFYGPVGESAKPSVGNNHRCDLCYEGCHTGNRTPLAAWIQRVGRP